MQVLNVFSTYFVYLVFHCRGSQLSVFDISRVVLKLMPLCLDCILA